MRTMPLEFTNYYRDVLMVGDLGNVCGSPFVIDKKIGVMDGLSGVLFVHMYEILDVRTVMIGEFPRSPYEIWNLFEIFWSLYVRSFFSLCYTFQGSGMLCIWLNRFELWSICNVSW